MSSLALQPGVRVVEVGLRDGLQSVERIVPTEAKIELVEHMIDAGVRDIEVASFAHPRVLPQLADAEAVLAAVPRQPGVRYRALVPNLRGAHRAGQCELDYLVALTCCDEEVSRLNQGSGVAQVLADLPAIGEIARAAGAALIVGIAMAYFTPCVGATDPAIRLELVRRAVDAGAVGVYFGDTVGMANPVQIVDSLETTRAAFPTLEIGLHLHARNGFALANVLAALGVGVDWLESAFCGIGGDLWFPGEPDVLGNLPTEDLLAFTGALGVTTGIDEEAYARVSELARLTTGRESLDHRSRGGSAGEMTNARWSDILRTFKGVTTTRQR
ncbi:pyruvate carboxyltransferase [Frankia sp. CcI49]|uniref:pyruvate carboxyltransferase n=1 Tax=unclassified Frankia TaxID=2632575 RepID=UPI0006CA4779|nr:MULTISPECIES: pyruvate carboxyltransferase [unclassified Frankia]KPM54160.1 pyruvate carboxyltransferase [Frankia sp. R43]ONH61588.1 pyruvate carboxyltransferase [Frankia sp. CcI49]